MHLGFSVYRQVFEIRSSDLLVPVVFLAQAAYQPPRSMKTIQTTTVFENIAYFFAQIKKHTKLYIDTAKLLKRNDCVIMRHAKYPEG